VVALADRQVAQPAPGIPGLPDVQQPSARNVDAVDGMVTDRRDAGTAGIDQELSDLIGELVLAVLPGHDIAGS